MLDYFYTAPRLKENGLIAIDDTNIPTVNLLVDFLRKDQNWKNVKEFPRRTIIFRKVGSNLNVEWTQQAFNFEYRKREQSLAGRVVAKLYSIQR